MTTQMVLATAALEEQPIAPPYLGQGFESGQTQGADPRVEQGLRLPKIALPVEPMIPAIDVIEPLRPEAQEAPAAQPAQPAKVPASARSGPGA